MHRSEDSHQLTAFITPWGLFEWLRVPFGLKPDPAFFQRFMESCFHDYQDQFVLPYLDDILVYSKTFEDHPQYIRLTLRRQRKKSVKMKTSKCMLFQRQVAFLGHIISEEGYHFNPIHVFPLKKYLEAPPNNIGEVHSTLIKTG